MARLGGDNNVADSLVVLSSDEEGEDDSNKKKKFPEKPVRKEQQHGIPPDFMCLVRTLRKYLEEKDDRRCNILGLMYKKASKTLTSSEKFRSFIKDIITEIEKGKTDRAHVLLLLTAVCQTLAVGEIVWSPGNPDRSKSNKQSSKNVMEPETRKQCNAVKALLFNDSPPPVPKENKRRENSEAAKDKDKVVKKTGRGARQSFNNSIDKPKNKPTPKGTSAGVDAKVKNKAGENSDAANAEKKSGKGARQSFSGNNNDKVKNKQTMKGPLTDSTEVVKHSDKNDKKGGKTGKQNANSDHQVDLVSSSPEHEPDPFITDLSTEASYPAVLPSPKIGTSPENVDLSSTEMSNVIELDDFDVATIFNEEVESDNEPEKWLHYSSWLSQQVKTVGESSEALSPKPESEKNISSPSINDNDKDELSALDIDIDLIPKGKPSSRLLLNTITTKSSSSSSSPLFDSGVTNKHSPFDVDADLPKDKSPKKSLMKQRSEKRYNFSVNNSEKKSKSLNKETVDSDSSDKIMKDKITKKLPLSSQTKNTEKTPDAKQTKKSDKSSGKDSDEDTQKKKKVKESPLASPILSPYSRRSTFLKAIEKVKETSHDLRRSENVVVYAPEEKKEKKTGNAEKTETPGKKKKKSGRQPKGSKSTSPADSSDDEVLFVSEKPAVMSNLMSNTPIPPTPPQQTNALSSKELPMHPSLVHNRTIPRPDMPWTDPKKKSSGKSLLDMCMVYEITATGQKVPCPLVNNKDMPNVESSVLSSRETSQHLSGTEGISVVTPSKTYTTTVNSKSPVDLTASGGNPDKTNRFNNPTEYIIGRDGKAVEPGPVVNQSEKRTYTSENHNRGTIDLNSKQNKNSNMQKSPDFNPQQLAPNPPCRYPALKHIHTPGTNKSPLNKRAPTSAPTSAPTTPLMRTTQGNAAERNVQLSTGKSPNTGVLAKKGSKQIYRKPVKAKKLKSKTTTDVTVILDSSSEGSDNEDVPQDASQKPTEDIESISNVERNEGESLSSSSGDDFVTNDNSKRGKEKSTPLSVDEDHEMTPDKSQDSSNDKKGANSSESSEDEVMEITEPKMTDGNADNCNEENPSSVEMNEDQEVISDESPSASNDDNKERTTESSGDEEVTEVLDPNAPENDESKSISSTMNDEQEIDSDKSPDASNNKNVESTCESSGDEVAEVLDPNTPGDDSESNEDKLSGVPNDEKTEFTSEISGDEVSTEIDSNDLEGAVEGKDEVEKVEDNSPERNEVADDMKSPPESSGDEVTLLSDTEPTQEQANEPDKGESAASRSDTVKISDEDKTEDPKETSTSKVIETEKDSSNDDVSGDDTVRDGGVTKSPSVSPRPNGTAESNKQNGRKSIKDIANALKKKVEEKEEDEIKIIEPVTTVPITTSAIIHPSLRKEAMAAFSSVRPNASSVMNLSSGGAAQSNSHISSPLPTANEESNNQVILIGDDSDDEVPVNAEKVVAKKKPIPRGNNTGKTSNASKPPSLSRVNPAVASSKKAGTKPSNAAGKTITKKSSTLSKNKSVAPSSKTIVPPHSRPVLNLTCKRPTSAKNKSATVKTVSNVPTYVSNILSKKSSDTDEAPSSSILRDSEKTASDNNSSQSGTEKERPKLTTKKAKIRQLEIILERLERRINKYARQELSFKDMHSEESAYMQEARAKERYLYNWKLYCKLTGDDPDEVVSARKKVKVKASPFPQLNTAVERYINRSDIFPNLFEVKQVCAQANIKHNLDLKDNDLHHCAVDIFSEVGRKLQKRREKEFRTTSGSFLTDNVSIEEDPARKDEFLRKKLKQNKKIAKQRTEHVFKDFVRQQYEQTTGDIDDSEGSDSETSLNTSVIRRDVSDSESDTQDNNSDSDTQDKNSDNNVQDKNSDSDAPDKNSDSDAHDNNSDSDTQDKNSDTEGEECDNNLTLDQLRKKKRKSLLKGGVNKVVKKKRVDKTVISLTLSSSQEIAEQSGNKKIDYQVTIGSSSPKVKTIQNKNNNETRTKSPINQLAPKQQSQKLSLLQSKSKYFKGSKPTVKPTFKKQSPPEISTVSSETARPKVKSNTEKSSESRPHKTSEQSSNSAKRKRISFADKSDNRVISSTTTDMEAPGSDSKKPRISNSLDKPFTVKKKVLPSLVPGKQVLGTGETKDTDVPAKYIPLGSIRRASDSTPKGKDSSVNKEDSSKSSQHGGTIVLDDD